MVKAPEGSKEEEVIAAGSGEVERKGKKEGFWSSLFSRGRKAAKRAYTKHWRCRSCGMYMDTKKDRCPSCGSPDIEETYAFTGTGRFYAGLIFFAVIFGSLTLAFSGFIGILTLLLASFFPEMTILPYIAIFFIALAAAWSWSTKGITRGIIYCIILVAALAFAVPPAYGVITNISQGGLGTGSWGDFFMCLWDNRNNAEGMTVCMEFVKPPEDGDKIPEGKKEGVTDIVDIKFGRYPDYKLETMYRKIPYELYVTISNLNQDETLKITELKGRIYNSTGGTITLNPKKKCSIEDPCEIDYNLPLETKFESERDCKGTAKPCNSFDDQDSCDAQDGCSWTSQCDGEPIPCSELSDSECNSQDGCWLFGLPKDLRRRDRTLNIEISAKHTYNTSGSGEAIIAKDRFAAMTAKSKGFPNIIKGPGPIDVVVFFTPSYYNIEDDCEEVIEVQSVLYCDEDVELGIALSNKGNGHAELKDLKLIRIKQEYLEEFKFTNCMTPWDTSFGEFKEEGDELFIDKELRKQHYPYKCSYNVSSSFDPDPFAVIPFTVHLNYDYVEKKVEENIQVKTKPEW